MIENNTIVQKRIHRNICVGFFLVMAFSAVFVLSMITGSVPVSVNDILGILTGAAGDDNVSRIILVIRLPRVIMAAILGGALAVSGFLLQTFFGNPIAGPFVLGISSGAKYTVAINMIF
jgi:iron complex transport system permease protein